jgi:hypothetical protein
MGRTIDIFYTHRERPDGSGKDQVVMGRPQALVGRTIDIFYTYRERPDGSGKDQW